MRLVHSIQLERGCTCAWVGSRGGLKQFEDLVMQHRVMTNSQFGKRTKALENDDVKHIRETLIELRAIADKACATSSSERAAEEFDKASGEVVYTVLTGYTDLIAFLMAAEEDLGEDGGSFRRGSRSHSAASAFGKLKEAMGYQRAFLCAVLSLTEEALPHLPQRAFADFVLCLTRQKTEKVNVRMEAPPSMLQLLEVAFELHPELAAIQETLLRDFDVLALKRSGLTVEQWWKIITAHIDRMHELQVIVEEASHEFSPGTASSPTTSPTIMGKGRPPLPGSILDGLNSEISPSSRRWSASMRPSGRSRRSTRESRETVGGKHPVLTGAQVLAVTPSLLSASPAPAAAPSAALTHDEDRIFHAATLAGKLGLAPADAERIEQQLEQLEPDVLKHALLRMVENNSERVAAPAGLRPAATPAPGTVPPLPSHLAKPTVLSVALGDSSCSSRGSSSRSSIASPPAAAAARGRGTPASPAAAPAVSPYALAAAPSVSPPGDRSLSSSQRRGSRGMLPGLTTSPKSSIVGVAKPSIKTSPVTSRRALRNSKERGGLASLKEGGGGELGVSSQSDTMEISMEEIALARRIGSGGFSTTYKATWRRGERDGSGSGSGGRSSSSRTDQGGGGGAADERPETVAVKVASCAEDSFEQWRAELRALTKLQHPNVVRYLGYCAAAPTFCIVLEYMEGGDLAEALNKPTPPGFVLTVGKGVIAGIGYLHHVRLIHRDIKCANVLMAKGVDGTPVPKLTDFGVAVQLNDRTTTGGHSLTAETGTYRYMAPEVLRHEPYSKNADIFSYALVLTELVTHREVWHGLAPLQAAAMVALEDRRPPLPVDIPPPLEHIIHRAWCTKPDERPTAPSLLKELEVLVDVLSPEQIEWLDAPNGHKPTESVSPKIPVTAPNKKSSSPPPPSSQTDGRSSPSSGGGQDALMGRLGWFVDRGNLMGVLAGFALAIFTQWLLRF